VVQGSDVAPASSVDTDRLLFMLAEHLPPKTAAKLVAEISGEKANALYDRLLAARGA